jgi:3'-phosphoadenosine 5'-phosphosulfate (PAPS) 3'-phosphatase
MSAMDNDKYAMAEAFCSIAERAGHEILSVYHGEFEVRSKADSSPVTDADERAERLIIESLALLAPDTPVVAEESVAAGRISSIPWTAPRSSSAETVSSRSTSRSSKTALRCSVSCIYRCSKKPTGAMAMARPGDFAAANARAFIAAHPVTTVL